MPHFQPDRDRPPFVLFSNRKEANPIIYGIWSAVVIVALLLLVRSLMIMASLQQFPVPVLDEICAELIKFYNWEIVPLFK